MKCVILVDSKLPIGLLANTVAVLGLSLGGHIRNLIGEDIQDKSGCIHKGITNIPIPVLTSTIYEMSEIYLQKSKEDYSDVLFLGFCKTAQRCISYDEYKEKMLQIKTKDIEFIGLCLYGTKIKINKITGNHKLLKHVYLF
jgi:hypothetical protein